MQSVQDAAVRARSIQRLSSQPVFLNEFSEALLDGFYLKEGETVDDALARAAEAFCYGDYGLAQRIYEAAHKGWFMFASPVLSNAPRGRWRDGEVHENYWRSGTNLSIFWDGEKSRSMPISCFAMYVPDTIDGQMQANVELAALSVAGGGVGLHNGIRAIGGKAPGPIPFMKTMDALIGYYRQGQCYKPGTEILTEHGWVRFEDLAEGVKVACVTDDGQIRFERPMELVAEHYVGDMIRFSNENRGIDFTVTPDHSMVIQRKSRKFGWKAMEKVRASLVPQHNEARFVMSSFYDGPMEELTPWERLLIAHQADGYNSNPKTGKSGVEFHFTKQRKIDRLEEILDKGGFDYTKSVNSSGATKFYVKVPHLPKSFNWINLAEVTPGKALALLAEIQHWDASTSCNGWFTYTSTVEECADTVQALAFLAGCSSRKSEIVREGRSSKFNVHVSHSPFFTLETLEKESFEYDGMVYCAVVSTGKIVVRNGSVAMVCGNTRRGSCAYYMDIDHPDIVEHIRFRIPSGGDSARKSDNRKQFHNAVNVTDEFIDAVLHDKPFDLKCPHTGEVRETVSARKLWEEILETRALTGEPYIFKIDTANRALPQTQKDKGLRINGSNICIEITLPTNEERTFVCCLSSLNLEKYDEWKDTGLVADLVRFLDNVLQYFIDNAGPELAKAVRAARAERAIGIGTMGWHYYLMSKGIPFEGGGVGSAIHHTHMIYSKLREEAIAESEKLAKERGEPEDMIGSGRRNSHLFALAPNSNNSIILGTSPSIEPISGNAYSHSTRAGTFLVKNPYLEDTLRKHAVRLGVENIEAWLDAQWQSVVHAQGSVQHLDYLTDDEKKLYRTAFEMDQHWLVEQADARQQYICQSQSLNLFFPAGVDRAYYNSVHLKALTAPHLKSLYYSRMERGVNADIVKEIERKVITDWSGDDCVSCSG